MFKVKKLYLFILILILGLGLSGCDVGINDLENAQDLYGNQLGLDIKDILDPKETYNYLLDELELMNEKCFFDIQLAARQAFKILYLYSLADMSIESSSLTTTQLETLTELFETIKMINVYVSVQSDIYLPDMVYSKTNEAITLCNEMLSLL